MHGRVFDHILSAYLPSSLSIVQYRMIIKELVCLIRQFGLFELGEKISQALSNKIMQEALLLV